MAKNRWVYMLSVDEQHRLVCRIWMTRLLKFSTFQNPQVRRLNSFFTTKLRDAAAAEDLALLPFLMQMESSAGGEAILTGPDAASVARRVVETKRAYLTHGDGRRLHWQKEISVEPLWREGSSDNWVPTLSFAEDSTSWQFLRGVPPLALNSAENQLTTVQHNWPGALLDGFIASPVLPSDEVAAYCVRLQNRFPDYRVPIPEVFEPKGATEVDVVPILQVIRVESVPRSARLLALNSVLCARMYFRYGERRISWNDRAETIAFHRDGKPHVVERDRKREAEWLERVRRIGLAPRLDENQQQLDLFDFHAADFFLSADDPGCGWEDILRSGLPELAKEGWEVIQSADIRVTEGHQEIWYDKVEASGRDWYAYEAGIEFNGLRIPVVPLLQRWLASRPNLSVMELTDAIDRETFAVPIAKDGEAVLVPGDRIGRVLRALLDRLLLREPATGKLRISAWRAAELAEDGVEAARALDSVATLRRFFQAVREQQELQPVEPHPKFGAKLRPYQQLGLGWLGFLEENGLSGILADDMGLGKTVQVIAMLHRAHCAGNLGPVLVVTPTSVLRQWQSELGRFAEEISVNVHHGADREKNSTALLGHDLVLTTYGVMRQDVEMLQGIAWDWVILDEAHIIKNPLANTSRAVTRLTARHRLCLTGTPVENRLSDLWSLFRFVLPGLLGDLAGFNKEFAAASHDARGEGENPTQKILRELLRRRIAPFLMRRRKEDVLHDLPPKIEIDRLIPVSDRQAEVYESYRLRLHRELSEAIEQRGVGKAQLTILEGLLRLRQICCDLRLLDGSDKGLAGDDSAKLIALMELVEESKSENRPVLIFSQFVGMLRLIEKEVVRAGWSYSMLTGQTTRREEEIRRFQEGESDVFLISLKAGGLGLNLTRAETVIHYDPWWNPAAEAQATDRAHRIGQKKIVTMYRLVTEKTIEERILALHAAKRELAESLVGSAGDTPVHRIDAEVLEQLLGAGTNDAIGTVNTVDIPSAILRNRS